MAVLITATASSCSSQRLVVRTRPAAPVLVVRPAAPGPGYIWVGGDWLWQGGRYVYREGYWAPPRRGNRYAAGYWKRSRGGWFWVPGRWRR